MLILTSHHGTPPVIHQKRTQTCFPDYKLKFQAMLWTSQNFYSGLKFGTVFQQSRAVHIVNDQSWFPVLHRIIIFIHTIDTKIHDNRKLSDTDNTLNQTENIMRTILYNFCTYFNIYKINSDLILNRDINSARNYAVSIKLRTMF